MKNNITSKFRQCFTADEGKVLAVADLAQIEPRLTAHYAATLFPGNEANCPLLKVFSLGADLYASIVNSILKLGIPENKLVKSVFKKEFPKERALGKVIQLATTYGLGPDKLAWKLSKVSDREVTYGEAKQYIDGYWSTYWDVHALRKSAYKEVMDKGYLDTLFGRKVYLSRSQARQKGLNYKIQSSASDLSLLTQLWVEQACKEYGIEATFLLPVHDEVIYQLHEKDADNFKLLLKTVMVDGWKKYEPGFNLLVPLELEVDIGKTWAAKG